MTKAKPNTIGLKSRTVAQSHSAKSASGPKSKAPANRQTAIVNVEGDISNAQLERVVTLLQQRLFSGQVIAGAGLPISGVSSDVGAVMGGTGSGSNSSKGQVIGANVGSALKAANPIENEVANLAAQIEEVQNLINGLNMSLDPLLAHVQIADESEAEVNPSRSSESPHHRRLIDLSDGLSNVIIRMRYLQSRVRT